MAQGKNTPTSGPSRLAITGAILFLVSWLVPVYEGQETLALASELTDTIHTPSAGPDWLPGWGACHGAWNLLIEDGQNGDQVWKARVLGATCFSNLLMAVSLLAMWSSRRRLVLGALLLACAAWNAGWLYLTDPKLIEHLRPGYYLWLSSFAITGLGVLVSSRQTR
jgi:hypothetical protein